MKVLCNCWRKSDTCVTCYMASVEDWDQIQAITMSAEAQRRLQEDLRYLESINVWHLANLRSNPSPYGYHESMPMAPSYSHNQIPYGYINSRYLNSAPVPPPPTPKPVSGYGTSLPYPDLIMHSSEVSPQQQGYYHQNTELAFKDHPSANGNNNATTNIIADNYKDFTPVIQNSGLVENLRLKHLSLLPKEPEDYDADQAPEDDNGKKAVKFTADTVFVERDMDSPFWRAYTERRRNRRIQRQRKQLNAQIVSATYQPSLVEIVKTAFGKSNSGKDNNGNECKKGEVLVYDNASQTQNYNNSYKVEPNNAIDNSCQSRGRRKSSKGKFLQLLACQCCSSSTTQS